MGRVGFEHTPLTVSKTSISGKGGAKSDARSALNGVRDNDLAKIVGAWPSLPEHIKMAIDSVELAVVKRSMIEKAQPHTIIKVIRELVADRPMLPQLSAMGNITIIKFAKREFDLVLPADLTKAELIHELKKYVKRNTVETLKITRRETTCVMGDTQAAKLVLANMGPMEKRWKDKTETDISGDIIINIGVIESDGTDLGKEFFKGPNRKAIADMEVPEQPQG